MRTSLGGEGAFDSAITQTGLQPSCVLTGFGAEVVHVERSPQPYRFRLIHYQEPKLNRDLYWEQGANYLELHRDKLGSVAEIANPLSREAFEKSVTTGDDEHQWRSSCVMVENASWCGDQGFATVGGRQVHLVELNRLTEDWMAMQRLCAVAERLVGSR